MQVLEFEYEPEMEDTYRNSMLKTFKKTLDDGFFPFIILDSINDRVKHFEQFWSAAKTKGFEVRRVRHTASASFHSLKLGLSEVSYLVISRCMWLKSLQTLIPARREMSMGAY